MLLAEYLVAVVVEHFAAPAEETRVVGPLVRLLHDVSRVLVGLVELERLEHALDFEADHIDRAAALLEQLIEIGDCLVEVLFLDSLVHQTLCDFEIGEQLLVLFIDWVVWLYSNGLLQVNACLR